jgi:hypothetical protein
VVVLGKSRWNATTGGAAERRATTAALRSDAFHGTDLRHADDELKGRTNGITVRGRVRYRHHGNRAAVDRRVGSPGSPRARADAAIPNVALSLWVGIRQKLCSPELTRMRRNFTEKRAHLRLATP